MNKVKKFLFITFISLIGFWGSCKCFDYEAYVTIVNIGNIDMMGAVENDEAKIPAYSSETWAIPLDDRDEVVTVNLYAEPIVGGDHDESTATLYGDRDIITWLTGWDQVTPQAKLQKKSSYFMTQQSWIRTLE